MKTFFRLPFIPFALAVLVCGLPLIALAQVNFVPLVDLPYIDDYSITDQQGTAIGRYINAFYLIAITVAAFLAVVKIIFGGVKYMLSDVVTDKSEAKKDIRGALLGLLIVLAAVLILNTIWSGFTNYAIFQNAIPANIDFTSTSFNPLGGGTGGSGGTGPFDITSSPLDLSTATAQQQADYIADCSASGRQYTTLNNVGGSAVGICGDTTNYLPPVVSANPTDISNQQAYCHSNERPYTGTPLPSGETLVSCNAACTPQEQFSASQNRCIPYTESNPTIDCFLQSNVIAYPTICAQQNQTYQIGAYTYTFNRIDENTVQLDCRASIDLQYETECQNVCSSGSGTLDSNGICTFTNN